MLQSGTAQGQKYRASASTEDCQSTGPDLLSRCGGISRPRISGFDCGASAVRPPNIILTFGVLPGTAFLRGRSLLCHNVTGSASFASSFADAFSTSACRLFPCESIVTMAGKSLTMMCHMASGTPKSRKSTPSTSTMHFV